MTKRAMPDFTVTRRLMRNPSSWSMNLAGQQVPGKVHLIVIVIEKDSRRKWPIVSTRTACGRDVPPHYCTAAEAQAEGGPEFDDVPTETNVPTCEKCLGSWRYHLMRMDAEEAERPTPS